MRGARRFGDFAMPRLQTCLVILTLLLAAPAFAADGQLLRKQRVPANVHVGDVEYSGAQFEFACHPAADGALSISLILANPDGIRNFPLNDFEGPDAIGEQRDLAEWRVDTRGAGVAVKGPISGWYGVDGDGFLLSRSEPNRKRAALQRLATSLLTADAQRLRLSVAAPVKGEPLQAELMLEGRQDSIRAALDPCLR
jgi:hypothetical protein